jgi:hypothetical protein
MLLMDVTKVPENMSNKLELTISGSRHIFSCADNDVSVQEKLGDPDELVCALVDNNSPSILRYEGIEFHFSPEGGLVLLFKENKAGGVLLNEKM